MQINQLNITPSYENMTFSKKVSDCKTKETINSSCLNNNPIAHLNKANIAFGTMKKSQFSGIDLIMVNKLTQSHGFNIQKINTNEEFQKYCQNILDENYLGEDNIDNLSASDDLQAQEQKKKILSGWCDYVVNENNAYNPATELFILSYITKTLNKSTKHLPPVLDKIKVTDTIQEITDKCKTEKSYNPDFDKLYRTNLKKPIFGEKTNLDENLNGWIIIPSEKHDSENFEDNVKKLQILSPNTWCTQSFSAKSYLEKGDFHIYMEKGQPKLGLRFKENEILEIQGANNDAKVPLKYLEIAKSHIKNNNYEINEFTKYRLQNAEKMKAKIDSIKYELENDLLKNDEYDKILPKFGIDVEKDEDGMLILSHYEQPDDDYTYDSIGIDETNLFKSVKRIKSNAYFKNSKIISLGNLQSIGGNAKFANSKITSLGNLQSIDGIADFEDSQVTDLGNLQHIGGSADFRNSQIISLGNLESIDRNAYFKNSQIKSLGNLKSIGNSANFENSKVISLGNLQSIGGSAKFANSQITSLGNLNSIGTNADFEESQITDLGKLQSIGWNANFKNSQITSLGNLQSIGGGTNFENSKITSLGNLKSIGRDANFENSQITSLGKLQSIGRDANFKNSQITSLGNLQSISRSADFENSKVISLGNLQSIGGRANFKNSKVISLGNLQSIGYDADFKNSKITSLENLQSIGWNADFKNSKIISLGNLQSINGFADFRNTQIISLGNLKSIGEWAYFGNSQITDLGELQSIGWDADFKNSQITSLGELQSIGGDANFEDSQVTDLGKLQHIGGMININNSLLKKEDFADIDCMQNT